MDPVVAFLAINRASCTAGRPPSSVWSIRKGCPAYTARSLRQARDFASVQPCRAVVGIRQGTMRSRIAGEVVRQEQNVGVGLLAFSGGQPQFGNQPLQRSPTAFGGCFVGLEAGFHLGQQFPLP